MVSGGMDGAPYYYAFEIQNNTDEMIIIELDYIPGEDSVYNHKINIQKDSTSIIGKVFTWKNDSLFDPFLKIKYINVYKSGNISNINYLDKSLWKTSKKRIQHRDDDRLYHIIVQKKDFDK